MEERDCPDMVCELSTEWCGVGGRLGAEDGGCDREKSCGVGAGGLADTSDKRG